MKISRKELIVTLLLHLSIWLLAFSMPIITEILNKRSIESAMELFRYVWIMPFSFALIFYVNYLFLIDRFLSRKYFVLFVLINIGLIYMLEQMVKMFYLQMGIPIQIPEMGTRLSATVGFFLMYILIIGICVAFKMTRSWYQAESARKELLQQTTESELKWLKSQLNPHFLFNTLNNIYSQITVNPENAKESVKQLSDMLRYVLYDSSEKFVPLEDELEFIRNYIELMRIRLSSRVTLKANIPEGDPGVSIIPLLFISLIENAFKHGISASKPSFIRIDFEQSDTEIRFFIENSYFPKTESDKGGSRIGLINIQKRLELGYPGEHCFTYGRVGDIFQSELIIKKLKSKKI